VREAALGDFVRANVLFPAVQSAFHGCISVRSWIERYIGDTSTDDAGRHDGWSLVHLFARLLAERDVECDGQSGYRNARSPVSLLLLRTAGKSVVYMACAGMISG
jgi:hypothetical protein